MEIRNRRNKFIALILFTVFLLNISIVPIVAEAETNEIIISTVDDFLKVANDCKTDSYSKGKIFSLQNDLDLSEVDFVSIPVFTGIFKGNGHTIAGVEYEGKGSNQGLFRIIDEGAVVENLKVKVKIETQGEQSYIGGICAVNRGTINNCIVSGYVSGTSEIGGIAGINEKTGEILESTSMAKVKGKNQTGGITGTNKGIIRNSTNNGKVNIEANEWGTNTGGIAGRNDGSIKNCTNTGDVGYPHTGYNTGGITGILTGYLEGCSNKGMIEGRRDVGGIAGQLDISYKVEHSVNYLEELSNELNGVTGSLKNLVENVGKVSSSAASQLKNLLSQSQQLVENLNYSIKETINSTELFSGIEEEIKIIKTELTAIEGVLEDLNLNNDNIKVIIEDIKEVLNKLGSGSIRDSISSLKKLEELLQQLMNELPSVDDYLELTTVSESARKITEALNNMIIKAEEGVQQGINDTATSMGEIATDFDELIKEANGLINVLPESMGQISKDMDSVNKGFNNVGKTIEKISKGPSDVTKDLSEFIEEEADGSILSSTNFGNVSADYNSGGIVGSVQRENILDPEAEESTQVSDYIFADSTVYIKATIYNCSNSGSITTKYDHSGGIVGKGRNGAVIDSINTGIIKADKNYAGGIAGDFSGIILRSYTSGYVEGKNYVGGIAGRVKNISESITIATIEGSEAYIGAVAGETNGEVMSNYFIDGELGGIDGINFEGKAMPITYEEILALEKCPEVFKKLEVKFVAEDNVVDIIYVTYGGMIEKLPEVEKQGDKYWVWDDFDKENITHSQTIQGDYHDAITVLSTGEKVPMFVAEGVFYPDQKLQIKELPTEEAKNSFKKVAGLYEVQVTGENAEPIKLHYKDNKKVKLYENSTGQWRELETEEDGSYLVFEINNGGQFLVVNETKNSNITSIIITTVILVFGISAGLVAFKRKKKMNK